MENNGLYEAFASLIYVTDTESNAVMKMFPWKEKVFEDDDQIYYEAEIRKNGKTVLITAARADEMGMTAAAVLSTKLIQRYKPKYLIMPGIAAGIGDRGAHAQMYGDVILADSVWNYSTGKYVSSDEADVTYGAIGFQSRPSVIENDESINSVFEKIVHSENNPCHVLFGTLATGSAVVANREVVEKQILAINKDTIGLEMEGYGVAYAAKHAAHPNPYFIIAKSICDFADESKSNSFQKLAAHSSCEFIQFLLNEVLE